MKIDLKNIDKTNWKTYRFDQIARSISERVEPGETNLAIYVGLEHLDAEDIHIRRFGKPSDVSGQKLKCYPGDVIFGKRRAYQRKAAVVDFEGICSAHAFVLRANPEVIDPQLFPFFLHSDTFMHRAIDISVGGLSPTINWGDLKGQEFLLPPKEQQAQLAELLWVMDDVIERERGLLNSIQKYLVSYKENALVVGDQFVYLGKLISGITAGKSVNGTNEPVSEDKKGVLKVSAVGPNGFDPRENKIIINQSDFDSRYAVHKEDILITRANTKELVGRVCLVPNDYPNQMLCDKTLRLETLSGVDKHFLVGALSSRFIRNQIEGFATGTGGAMKNISQQEIRSLKIPAKTSVEQSKIGEKLKSTYNIIEIVRAKIDKSKALQKSLINQIF
jgi:type I restriction enzyme S subunit